MKRERKGDREGRQIISNLREAVFLMGEWDYFSPECESTLASVIENLDRAKDAASMLIEMKAEDRSEPQTIELPTINNAGKSLAKLVNEYSFLANIEYIADGRMRFPIGTDEIGNPCFIDLAPGEECGSVLIVGCTASGKSSIIKEMILSACHSFSDSQLEIFIFSGKEMDYEAFKKGNPPYSEIPHIKLIRAQGGFDPEEDVGENLLREIIARRDVKLASAHVNTFKEYNALPPSERDNAELPVMLIIMDDYGWRSNFPPDYMLSNLSEKGICIVNAVNSASNVSDAFLSQVGERIILPRTRYDEISPIMPELGICKAMSLAESIEEAEKGTFVCINKDLDMKSVQLAYASSEEMRELAEQIIAKKNTAFGW